MFDEYQLGLYEGKMNERERIIALLEAQLPTKIEDAFDELIGIHEVIALIKGENK